MVRATVLLCLGGCFTKPSLHEGRSDAAETVDAPAAWLEGSVFRKPITLTKRTAGSLVDYTASIELIANTDLAAHARSDGRDLRFTSGDGETVLPHELVEYGANGTLDAWVRIPELVSGDNALFVYYGGDSKVTSPSIAWSSSHAAVWHLGGTAPSVDDSVARRTLTAENFNPFPIAGIVGAGRDFDGGIAAMCGTAPQLGMSSFSFALWVRTAATGPAGMYDTPLGNGGNVEGSPGFGFELGDSPWAATIADGTKLVTIPIPAGVDAPWTHLVAVVERSTNVVRVYRDGLDVTLLPATTFGAFGSVNGTVPLCIGASPQPAGQLYYPFQGQIDEPRIYRVALDADAIATEYANIAGRASFQTLGAEQSR